MEWITNKTEINTGREKMRNGMLRIGVVAILVFATFAMAMMPVDARLAPGGVQFDRVAVVAEAYFAVTGTPYLIYSDPVSYPIKGKWNYLNFDIDAYIHTRDYWSTRYPYGYMSNNANATLKKWFYDYKIQEFGYAGKIGRGAQCKYFANLVLYRAGVRDASYTDPFPTYADMDKAENSKAAKYAKPGDVLFKKDYHTAIVTKVLTKASDGTATSLEVIDSNWVDGDGKEIIGIHKYTSDQISSYKVFTKVPYYNY